MVGFVEISKIFCDEGCVFLRNGVIPLDLPEFNPASLIQRAVFLETDWSVQSQCRVDEMAYDVFIHHEVYL